MVLDGEKGAPRSRLERLRRPLVLLAALSLSFFGGVAWLQLERWRATEHLDATYADAVHCLLGPEPAIGQADRRLRAIAIAASLDPAAHTDWPRRCTPPLAALLRRIQHVREQDPERACQGQCCPGATRCTALEGLREQVMAGLERVQLGRSDRFDPDQLLRLGAALDLDPGGSSVAAPPAPVALLDPAAMRPLHTGGYLRLLTDPASGDDLELLFYSQNVGYGHCAVGLASGQDAACGALPAALPAGFAGELLAREPGAPARMFAHGGEGAGWHGGLFDPGSGRQIVSLRERPAGGFVWADGTMAYLAREPHDTLTGAEPHALFVATQGGVRVQLDIGAGEPLTSGPQMVWDQVVWSELREGRQRLMARRVAPGALGPPSELATLPAGVGPPQLEMCRSDGALVLLAVGARSDGRVAGHVVFRPDAPSLVGFPGEGMSPVAHAEGWRGPMPIRAPHPRFGFTCDGPLATLTWVATVEERAVLPGDLSELDARESVPVTGRYRVDRVRCDPHGCDREHATVALSRYGRTSRYVAGDVGGAMLVLWRSPMGDVRMRRAPIDRLAEAPEVPVFDDVEHDGFGWDLERDPIFGRAGGLLVLVSRAIGDTERAATYGIRIDGEGAVLPVGVLSTR